MADNPTSVNLDLIDTRTCPACHRPKSLKNLLCRTCWRRVPKAKRDAVWLALDGWLDDRLPLGELRDAQADAIRSVL